MQPSKKPNAEYLGHVEINNGQPHAELRREGNPGGAAVVHAGRKSKYVHERRKPGDDGNLASDRNL